MPKLHLSIHIDQHGLQTINSDGDPSLWPLVGRLAGAAGPVQQPTATVINNVSGENAQERHQDHEHRVNTALVTLGWKGIGDMQAWAEMTRERIQAGQTSEAALTDAIGNYGTALIHLGWKSTKQNVMDWARALTDDQVALQARVDSIDAVLRPLVSAEEDSPEDVADLVAARIRGAEEQDKRIRAILEEAIGRTPDPTRSTRQLAIDLAEVLKAAVAAR